MSLTSREKGVLIASGISIVIGSVILSIGLPILFDLTQFGKNPKCFQELNCRDYDIVGFNIQNIDDEITTIEGSVVFMTNEIFSEANPIRYSIFLRADPQYVKQIYVLIDREDKDFNKFNGMQKENLKISLEPLDVGVSQMIEFRAIPLGYANGFTATDELVFFNTGKLSATILVVDKYDTVHVSKKLDGIFDLAPFESKIKADETREEKNSNKQILALTWLGLGLAFVLLAMDFIVRVVLKEH